MENSSIVNEEVCSIPIQDYPLPVKRVLPQFPSVTERYFEPWFLNHSLLLPQSIKNADQSANEIVGDDINKDADTVCVGDDGLNCLQGEQVVLFHSNKVAMICLAPRHPLLAQIWSPNEACTKSDAKLVKVDYDMESNKSLVQGKSKRGGQKLKASSVICTLNCDNGLKYPVYACLEGKLLEINSNLISQPELVQQKPWSDGYLALILPYDRKDDNVVKKYLLSPKDYQAQFESAR